MLFRYHLRLCAWLAGSLFFTHSGLAQEPQIVPPQPGFSAQGKVAYVPRSAILEYRALPSYSEPAYIKEKFVDTGKLPPVGERLPKEPMVYKTGNMPDGVGVYGDVMRHVIGGRPEGWNYSAGQNQGWGGLDIGLFECLTRTGPLFQVEATDMEPLPNLAKSWEWSEDGHKLTMKLIEGAKWSDGEPFDSEDIMFYWEDNVLDPNVTPTNGASPETFGEGTTLRAIDGYTIEWTFKEAFPRQHLFAMAYGTFCPGPAHILKTKHPKYAGTTYNDYKNGWPPEFLNWPVMGAWVPVGYRSDDIVILRRNPYYWKVDEKGHQLPYLNELHYKLSTWANRDVQTVAGSGDFSNLEQPENFVESLRRAADDNAPARLAFGSRTVGYSLYLNFSANGWGSPDERGQAVRDLNRNLDFRKAISIGLDRQALGEALVRGPFTAIYPGGLLSGSSFYDRQSTMYYPHNIEAAKTLLKKAGLVDTDGNGFVNFPADTLGGKDVQIVMLGTSDNGTDRNLLEGVVAQMEKIGLKVIINSRDDTQRDTMHYSGQFDWLVRRAQAHLSAVLQDTPTLAPVGPRTSWQHRAGSDGTLDLMPFEQELVDIINSFVASNDNEERAELMKRYQRVATTNIDSIGLVEYPGALMVNKRFANIPSGAPILLFNWAEGAIMRERVFVPEDKQRDYELFPETLPGEPGGSGPVQ